MLELLFEIRSGCEWYTEENVILGSAPKPMFQVKQNLFNFYIFPLGVKIYFTDRYGESKTEEHFGVYDP